VRLHAARNMPPVPSTHVGIVCAASAHVNVRTFYQPLTALTGLGLLGIAPRRSFSGRAARGSVAPRKMACRPLAGKARKAVQGHRLAQRGAACRCPLSNRKREWTPRRAILLCSAVCRSSAVVSLGSRVILFWVVSSLRSVESPLSA